jgi:hypothetical protein
MPFTRVVFFRFRLTAPAEAKAAIVREAIRAEVEADKSGELSKLFASGAESEVREKREKKHRHRRKDKDKQEEYLPCSLFCC